MVPGDRRLEVGAEIPAYRQGSQSTAPVVPLTLLKSWMYFSIEKTPVTSSTDLPTSKCLPLQLVFVSMESQPMWPTPMTLALKLASMPLLFTSLRGLFPTVLIWVLFIRLSAWVYCSVTTAPAS